MTWRSQTKLSGHNCHRWTGRKSAYDSNVSCRILTNVSKDTIQGLASHNQETFNKHRSRTRTAYIRLWLAMRRCWDGVSSTILRPSVRVILESRHTLRKRRYHVFIGYIVNSDNCVGGMALWNEPYTIYHQFRPVVHETYYAYYAHYTVPAQEAACALITIVNNSQVVSAGVHLHLTEQQQLSSCCLSSNRNSPAARASNLPCDSMRARRHAAEGFALTTILRLQCAAARIVVHHYLFYSGI